MKSLLNKLKIDETFTKAIKKPIFDKVKENTYPVHDYNYMADILFLPTTKQKYKYLLCIVDLWSNEFDMEPLKTKEPDESVIAMEKIFKRPFIKKPKASIQTDAGNEFRGSFDKYLHDNSIVHRTTEPARHQQMGNVENLNKQLGRLFNGYMNMKEKETGKPYCEWTDILTIIRNDLNKSRERPDGNPYTDIPTPFTDAIPKFKIGDIVVRKLERPHDALGNKQNTTQFRVGDVRFDVKNPRKIVKILYYSKNIRYMLNTIPNVSYTETELKKVEGKNEEEFVVKQILDKKMKSRRVHYLVWFKGELKSQAIWLTRIELLKDGLKDMLDEYDGLI